MPPPDPSWTSLLPPLVAIGLAVVTRQVYLSLGAGVWLGYTVLAGGDPFAGLGGAIEGLVGVFGDAGNTRVLLFTLVIGALIATVEASGGVRGFVDWIERRGLVRGARGARMLAALVGVVVFIESNITCLVAGAVSRPLFDRHRSSREMLAYLLDSTSAPICILIPLNAWGAYVLALLADQGIDEPVRLFVEAIPLNFYALAALALALFVAWTGWAFGPMRRAEARTAAGQIADEGAAPAVDERALVPEPVGTIPPRAVNMLLPLGVLVAMMPLGLVVTGGGDLFEGSGSTSVLWAVLAGLATAWALLLAQRGAAPASDDALVAGADVPGGPVGAHAALPRRSSGRWRPAMSIAQLTETGLRGAGGMLGMALILLLALALGAVTRELGAGPFVADLVADALPPWLFLPLVFVVGAVVSFATGTSWGTFAIMIPIAVPAAAAAGLPLAPFLAASLAGGVFGDHASPISDTTIMSSLAAASDHIAHVRTQLPYALLAGAVAVVAFAITGALL